MPQTSFTTNPFSLEALLSDCRSGSIQLPDFQRSWVWGEDRIISLIASVSRAFPIGALMTLASKPDGTSAFARRPVQGAPKAAEDMQPGQLLLDGQQRMTSLFQACMRREVVETITPKNKLVRRWFYLDIQKTLRPDGDREEAIVGVPEDKRIRANFNRDVVLDLSTAELEFEQLMFPLNQVFDWDAWQDGFTDYWLAKGDVPKRAVFKQFKDEVLHNFSNYQVPVIALAANTSHEAVCLVFEKVNTGGKALDAFELLTAMYAARGHKLREDWLGHDGQPGLQQRLESLGRVADEKTGVLAKVASTDVLQAIALLHTKEVREARAASGTPEADLPAVRATRQSLLDLPLEAYLKYREPIEAGFRRVAKFLREERINRVVDLPYQTQLVPLAAIFALIGDKAEHATHRTKISQWFWSGIFGELYGSAVESRFAKDVVEVPAWLDGGPTPTTVREGAFRPDRLLTMRTRLSAAYKGVHALLMREGARDFRTGQSFDTTVFFEENVDIHHIFPVAWCQAQKLDPKYYDSVINKTPLSYRTNRIIGGVAPSAYLEKLEAGRATVGGKAGEPPIERAALDGYLSSHCIDVGRVRADDFNGFIATRRSALLALIAAATGRTLNDLQAGVDEGEELTEALAHDAGLDEKAE